MDMELRKGHYRWTRIVFLFGEFHVMLAFFAGIYFGGAGCVCVCVCVGYRIICRLFLPLSSSHK
jgi:hypothetical protein